MSIVNAFMTWLFDVLFLPFAGGPGWLSLLVFSALASVFGLLVYKYTSNQKAIRAVKDRIKADMLAIKLFKDDPAAMFRSFGGVLWSSVMLLRYSLVPLAVMIVPFVLVMAQLATRYQWRPLWVGETAVITARLSPDVDVTASGVLLQCDEGALADVLPLRIPSEHEVLWRVRVAKPGTYVVRLTVGEQSATKTLTVGEGWQRVSPVRPGGNLWQRLLYPSEPRLPADSSIRSVALSYPDRDGWFSGSTMWFLWLIGLSFVLAFVFKPILRVEF